MTSAPTLRLAIFAGLRFSAMVSSVLMP
jgi:hypothetical protein